MERFGTWNTGYQLHRNRVSIRIPCFYFNREESAVKKTFTALFFYLIGIPPMSSPGIPPPMPPRMPPPIIWLVMVLVSVPLTMIVPPV